MLRNTQITSLITKSIGQNKRFISENKGTSQWAKESFQQGKADAQFNPSDSGKISGQRSRNGDDVFQMQRDIDDVTSGNRGERFLPEDLQPLEKKNMDDEIATFGTSDQSSNRLPRDENYENNRFVGNTSAPYRASRPLDLENDEQMKKNEEESARKFKDFGSGTKKYDSKPQDFTHFPLQAEFESSSSSNNLNNNNSEIQQEHKNNDFYEHPLKAAAHKATESIEHSKLAHDLNERVTRKNHTTPSSFDTSSSSNTNFASKIGDFTKSIGGLFTPPFTSQLAKEAWEAEWYDSKKSQSASTPYTPFTPSSASSTSTASSIASVFAHPTEQLSESWSKVKEAVTQTAEGLKSKASEMTSGMKDEWAKTKDLQEGLTNAKDAVSNKAEELKSKAEDLIAGDSAKQSWNEAKETVSNKAEDLKSSVMENAPKAQTVMQEGWNSATEGAENAWEKAKAAASNKAEEYNVKESWNNAKETIANKAEDLKEAVQEKMDSTSISDTMMSTASSVGEKLKEGAQVAAEKIPPIAKSVAENVKDAAVFAAKQIPPMAAATKELIGDAWHSNTAEKMKESASNAMSSVKDSVKESASSAMSSMKESVKETIFGKKADDLDQEKEVIIKSKDQDGSQKEERFIKEEKQKESK